MTRLPRTPSFRLDGKRALVTGASSGIGFRLQDARQFIQTDRMFVGLIELGILGALLDSVFVLISRRLVHWESA